MRKALCAQHAAQEGGGAGGLGPRRGEEGKFELASQSPPRWPRSSIQGHFPYHFIRAIGAAE